MFVFDGEPGVAPTLRVWPGDTIVLNLQNRLPPTNFTANSVNIHFHGLDISPSSGSDDVVSTLAGPGRSLKYVVHIPLSQQPGLYWYHPHSHGEAYWQVTSGMSGAMIVEGLAKPFASLKERLLVLRDMQIYPGILGIPWYARRETAMREMSLARSLGAKNYRPSDPDDSSPGGACSPEPNMRVTVEGTDSGVLKIAPGERQLFRVLNASAGRVFDLAIDGSRLGLVAMDGYPLSVYPGTPDVLWKSHLVVAPGARAEFIVVGQSKPVLLRSRCYDSGAAGDRDPELLIARLQPEPRGPTGLRPGDGRSSAKVLSEIVPVEKPALIRRVVFSEDSYGYYINHRAFDMKDMAPMFVARSGTMEEWLVENQTDEVHALHIHQTHFVVESVDDRASAPRYWVDTALIPPRKKHGGKYFPGRIALLVDFRNPAIKGLFPFHCHMLDHEDGGMMALIKVL